ncbi:MAG TPA: DUF4965 domain-containing protein, partial [Isosphaeraceae bacterium]|nr:DUF4965 domain-containing protein [Isosphaeraceae bacterium]
MMRLPLSLLLAMASLIAPQAQADQYRPPAVPLVTHDPYFSVWSSADRLTDDVTRHWTHAPQPLNGVIRVDGQSYRFMGPEPAGLPALAQVGLEVRPTQTIYHFASSAVGVDLTFLTPALPADLDLMARPVTYVIVRASSRDGKPHKVETYLGASALLTVNDPEQKVVWSLEKFGTLNAAKVGTDEQPVLQRAGDSIRIDWGYLYLTSVNPKASVGIVEGSQGAETFDKTGTLPEDDAGEAPRAAQDRTPTLAVAESLGEVGKEPVEAVFLLAYDDDKAIDYMGQWLSAYWKRDGSTIGDALQAAANDFGSIRERCDAFDKALTADMENVGGALYAELGALAHRESLAASKLVADAKGMPLWFPKENSSNGCIGTVDVIYPQIPQLLLMNPELAKASVVPVLDYASSKRWKFPFAPHDLGTYPLATGQVYGGGERTDDNQMPVEESGNMLIIVEAIATLDGNADFASRYWTELTKWAEFLEKEGFDPANQLSTDDFAGHLARNANLSIKAIIGLACYGKLAGMRG